MDTRPRSTILTHQTPEGLIKTSISSDASYTLNRVKVKTLTFEEKLIKKLKNNKQKLVYRKNPNAF